MAFHLLAAPLCVFSFSTTGVVENVNTCIGDLAKARADMTDLEIKLSMVKAMSVGNVGAVLDNVSIKERCEAMKRFKPKVRDVDRGFRFLHVTFHVVLGASQCDHSRLVSCQRLERCSRLNCVISTDSTVVFTLTLTMSVVSSVSPSFSAAHRYVPGFQRSSRV